MINQEKPKLTLVSESAVPDMSDIERSLSVEQLIAEYACGIEAKPEWCIWVNDGGGGATVLFWIKPAPESELVARRIAKHLKSQGVLAGVDMNEWNPDLRGKPIYAQNVPDEPEKTAA